MPKIPIADMKGLNTTLAQLQLPPGEFVNLQNVRGRPFHNLAKRKGVEPVTSSTSAIQGIFDIELDDIIIPIFQQGGTLTFFPGYASGSVPNTPDPFPDPNPLGGSVGFLIEPTMRALQERYMLAQSTGGSLAWPNRLFDQAGNAINQAIPTTSFTYRVGFSANAQFPADKFYQYDLFWYDRKHGVPAGTRKAQLVNSVRSNLDQTAFVWVGASLYVDSIEGQANTVYLTNATLPLPAVATFGTAGFRLEDCKSAIRKLTILTPRNGSGSVPNWINAGFQGLINPATFQDNRSGVSSGASVTCPAAKTEAFNNWLAASWSAGGSSTVAARIMEQSDSATAFEYDSLRSHLLVDLTTLPGTWSAGVYFKITPTATGTDPLFGGYSNNPPVTADNAFHIFGTPTCGISSFSTTLGGDNPATTIGGCPVTPTQSKGWQIKVADYVVATAPVFSNFI